MDHQKYIQFQILKRLLKNNNINQLNPVTIEQTNVPSEINPSIQYLTAPEVRFKT